MDFCGGFHRRLRCRHFVLVCPFDCRRSERRSGASGRKPHASRAAVRLIASKAIGNLGARGENAENASARMLLFMMNDGSSVKEAANGTARSQVEEARERKSI